MLKGKYVIVVENILSEITFNCIFSRSDGLSLMQALVAQSAPVNFVDMDKSFVLDSFGYAILSFGILLSFSISLIWVASTGCPKVLEKKLIAFLGTFLVITFFTKF